MYTAIHGPVCGRHCRRVMRGASAPAVVEHIRHQYPTSPLIEGGKRLFSGALGHRACNMEVAGLLTVPILKAPQCTCSVQRPSAPITPPNGCLVPICWGATPGVGRVSDSSWIATDGGWRVFRGMSAISENHSPTASAQPGVFSTSGIEPRVETLGHGVFRNVRGPLPKQLE